MDDLRGRRVAQAMGFRYFGTLGFLLRAKRAGLIDSLETEIQSLKSHGLYLDDAIVKQVLRASVP